MKLNFKILSIFAGCFALFAFAKADFYPIDGYKETGISRLARLEKIQNDSTKTLNLPAGALLPSNCIMLNLVDVKDKTVDELMTEDVDFEKKINSVIPNVKGYSVTAMDITDPNHVKYAAYKQDIGYQPGSVGKLAVLVALFTQLHDICPESWDARTGLLQNKKVLAGQWALYDHHTIPDYDVKTGKFRKRKVKADDVFTLYEWVDHMTSVSNNGAASVVWREALLMAAFKDQYEYLTQEQIDDYFKNTPRKELTLLANKIVNEPLRKLGITKDEWRLGSFFTSGAKNIVSGIGGSIGTPVGLMKFLVQLEQGNIIDERSSLEMKRFIYMTDRRIRYAYSPRLHDAAVYFKSGSYYKCDRSGGKSCGDYEGNVFNYMNSVAIVEHPNGKKYMVCLMTNVLGKNSAYDHMILASRIDKVITETEDAT